MITIKNSRENETLIYAKTFEYEAYDQIKRLSNFEPYLNARIRVMPDAHAGMGCTVGTTMTLDGKVTPNLVGVDIGCLDNETEYLTKSGWKRIDSYKDDEILQYDKNANIASFVKPEAYIVKDCEFFYHLHSKSGLDQMLSKDHKILFWKGVKNRGYTPIDYFAETLVEKHNSLSKGIQGGIKTVFDFNGTGVDFTDDEIRLMMMISADGTIRKSDGENSRVELHFKKERKIRRAFELLDSCHIGYSAYRGSDLSVSIIFHTPAKISKSLSVFWNATQEQLKVMSEECLLWDGHKGVHRFYSTTVKENADVVQFAFAANNIRCGIYTPPKKKENWNQSYVVYLTENNIVGIPPGKIEKVKSVDGKQYCFTVPSGYFVARRNNRVFITGNCGMLTVELKDRKLDLEKLDRVIHGKVPCGFSVHNDPRTFLPLDDLICKDHVDLRRALCSIGTLGGGNHFIEVDKSEGGNLFLVIHSGSRKLGQDVCKYYQDKAFRKVNEMGSLKEELVRKLTREGRKKDIQGEIKKLEKPRADKELAFLEGKDFDDYIHDMKIVQSFASCNRMTMATTLFRTMEWGEMGHRFETVHNYIDFKRMILRKGAVSAESGEVLLIPINMRDGSLLCMGLGNPEWNFSAPHGAGRLMSRSKAKELIDMKAFEDSMKGIYSTSVVKETLDESPMAYKSMEEIVECIQDTVEILSVLKPVYNFKAH